MKVDRNLRMIYDTKRNIRLKKKFLLFDKFEGL